MGITPYRLAAAIAFLLSRLSMAKLRTPSLCDEIWVPFFRRCDDRGCGHVFGLFCVENSVHGP
jgi:hypothetical protein